MPHETVSFFGTTSALAIFDNGTDKRLEIGADHFIPTRSGSNKTTYFNEANQDMDFQIESVNTTPIFFVDASADKIGIGTNTPGYVLDVVGDVNVSTGKTFKVN